MQFAIDLIRALGEAKDLVVFTGAGVSQESGVPTFRDALTGLWENFDAEELATKVDRRRRFDGPVYLES